MRIRRIVTPLAAALLVGSAALSYAAAWQRWSGYCGWGDLNEPVCEPWQDHLYDPDALWPNEPWIQIGTMTQLLGLASLVQALALVLLPWALGRRSRAWQQLALAMAAFTLTYVGLSWLQAGITGHPVDPVGESLMGFLWFFGLPMLLPLALFTKDADGQRAGLRGGFVVWMLVMAMPYFQLVGWGPMFGGVSYDTAPWTEAAVVPFLVAAALALKPWSMSKSASHEPALPSLSLPGSRRP